MVNSEKKNLNMASSNNIVDLSADNDSGVHPNSSTTNTSGDQFERSCDNPECSAPKLISKIPKQVTSEFITNPKVISKPTLVNGFTTLFRVDGNGTKMEDLMNEYTAAESNATVGKVHKPKTVFRVVPNTHAHIVNYVVVESAGETLQKIKENDPDTIRKLLVSQRLSAEQMLKKLIGKALETPTRAHPPAPMMAQAPAASKLQAPVAASVPLPDKITTPNPPSKQTPIISPTPISVLTSPKPSTPIVTSTPRVPSGITIKPLSNSVANKTATAPPSTPVSKTIEKPKATSLPTVSAANESTPRPSSTSLGSRAITASKPVVWQAVTPGTAVPKSTNLNQTAPLRRTQPVGISPTKLANSSVNIPPTPVPTARNQLSSSKPSSSTGIKRTINSSQPKNQSHVSQVTANQQQNILKRKGPDATLQTPEAIKRLRRYPNRTHTMTPLADKSLLAKSNAISSSTPNRTLPTLPKDYKSQSVFGRTQTVAPKMLITPKPIEKLAGPASVKKDITKKLPMLPVLKSSSTAVTTSTVDQPIVELSNVKPPFVEPPAAQLQTVEPPTVDPLNVETPTVEPSTDTPRKKKKPLMGPASKMRALKAIAEAKEQEAKNNALKKFESGPLKIGDTYITKTSSSKITGKVQSPVNSLPNANKEETVVKPCTVAITDIAKNSTTTDSDSDSIKTRSSRQGLKTSFDKEKEKEKANQSLIDKYRGRITLKKVQAGKSSITRAATRSAVASAKPNTDDDNLSDSTLLTSPSAPSRVLKVVLPSQKNGVVNNPPTSPHPNLKISSVISGGTPIAGNLKDETLPVMASEDNMDPGIEQLQKELADLRRTVARLTQNKQQ